MVDQDDVELLREAWLAEREAVGEDALVGLADEIEACGGKVTWTLGGAMMLGASLPGSCIASLAKLPELAGLELDSEHVPEADAGHRMSIPGDTISGRELEDLLQSYPFYLDGYYGSAKLGYAEGLGNRTWIHHPGFEDATGNVRVHPYDCLTGVFCWASDYDPGDPHPTAAVSILAGDITRGQDPDWTLYTDRVDRSGVARTSHVYAANFTIGWDMSTVWLDHGVRIGAIAESDYLADPDCEGKDGYSVTTNALYEAGIAVIKSAGNASHTSSTDCTVGAPASAIGVFAIAASNVDLSGGSVEEIYWRSARGGTSTQGRGRNIIGVTGPSDVQNVYPNHAWPQDGQGVEYHYGTYWGGADPGPSSMNATSAATPAVAGAAELFRQWYATERNSMINEPGLLYANLLLMGDRASGATTTVPQTSPTNIGYNNLWGAGQLRLRKYNAEGLDNPARYGSGKVCVGFTQMVDIDLTPSGPMDDDVDIIKAVAWWYDHRHDDLGGPDNDNLSMTLLRDGLPVVLDASPDNRLRVVDTAPVAGSSYTLRLTGSDVSSDVEGCGTNSTMVYYAYLWEDGDRETGEDPELWWVRPE